MHMVNCGWSIAPVKLKKIEDDTKCSFFGIRNCKILASVQRVQVPYPITTDICRPPIQAVGKRTGGCRPQDAVNHVQTISTKCMCSHGSPTVGYSTSCARDPFVLQVNAICHLYEQNITP